MNTNKNGNPGKRLLGFFHIINLLPVVVIGEYFFNEDGIPPIYLPSRLAIVARRKSEANGKNNARYSSDSQTEQSIEGQLRVCQDFAKNNDILIVDTYIDRAMTGRTIYTPIFNV